jgi:sialic acid synthase
MEIEYKKPVVVAEIGCNHMGDFNIALELITIAKNQGADFVKFQKRNNKELLTDEQYHLPHPDSRNSFGSSYGEHREYLEFTIEQHKQLKDHCEKTGIKYACSVWDITSAQQLIILNPEYIKIPSACNNNTEMLEFLRDEFTGDVHISLGMTTRKEEENIIRIFSKNESTKGRLVLYACTSAYPISESETYLLEIKRLREAYGLKVKSIGFSAHYSGIAMDIAAYTLGATWFERHFTKDRTWKGTDQAASLEPQGLYHVVRDLNSAWAALRNKPTEILDIEIPSREKLKYRNQNK